MRYTVRKSIIQVVGTIWMPAVTAAYTYTLTKYDLDNIGEPTRENVDQWLSTHAGDFQRIIDFRASLEIGSDTVEIPWSSEENEMQYFDCVGEEV